MRIEVVGLNFKLETRKLPNDLDFLDKLHFQVQQNVEFQMDGRLV